MNRLRKGTFILLSFLIVFSGSALLVSLKDSPKAIVRCISYTVDPSKKDLSLFWKDDKNVNFRSIQNLKTWVEKNNRELVFAMNGGMYMTDNSPLGLYIENGKTINKTNTANGKGNFYMKPNGVFYISKDKVAGVCKTEDFTKKKDIGYATQSGPMLVIDGKIHPDFKKGSANLNVRNGVGILPDNKVVFAMSENEVNFYDFATYFQEQGCKNALYLDGFVSRTYLPEKKWTQTGGNFGVLIGVTERKK